MAGFHETVMGRRFFEGDVPKIATALAKIGDGMERIGRVMEVVAAATAASSAWSAAAIEVRHAMSKIDGQDDASAIARNALGDLAESFERRAGR